MSYLSVSSRDIAKFLGVEHNGPFITLKGVSSLKNPKHNTLIWSKSANTDLLTEFSASGQVFAIVPISSNITGYSAVTVEKPRDAFSDCLEKFFSKNSIREISKRAVISRSASIGKNVSIGANCLISGEVKIEDDVTVNDNVTIIGPGKIGQSSEILSGARLGVDSLAITQGSSQNKLMPQLGGFSIGTKCRIGVNSIVARGTIDDTILEENVMLGEQVLIGHNSFVGKGTVITAGAKICGSVHINSGVWVGPSATVLQGVEINTGVKLAAGAVLFNDAKKSGTYIGNPAKKFSISKD